MKNQLRDCSLKKLDLIFVHTYWRMPLVPFWSSLTFPRF
jgi:hypothetical protein